MDFTQWRRNRRYGITYRDQLSEALSATRERFWLCRVQGKHHEKMGSHGACYRCGKTMQPKP